MMSDNTPLWTVSIDGYRYVLYDTDLVEVYKNDSPDAVYKIANGICTCPAATYRSTECKHKKAVSRYRVSGSTTGDSEATYTVSANPDVGIQGLGNIF